jgi:hypothetical protein
VVNEGGFSSRVRARGGVFLRVASLSRHGSALDCPRLEGQVSVEDFPLFGVVVGLQVAAFFFDPRLLERGRLARFPAVGARGRVAGLLLAGFTEGVIDPAPQFLAGQSR